MTTPAKLGELLLEQGEINQKQLQQALEAQNQTGFRLGEVLIAQGSVSRLQVARGLKLQRRIMLAAFGAAMAFGPGHALAVGKYQRDQAPAKANPALVRPAVAQFPLLRSTRDAALQSGLDNAIRSLGLSKAVANKSLNLALVDITDTHHPVLASVNGDHMMYAASLPKIGILLGAFERIHDGDMKLDDATREQLTRMIRNSSNTAATAMYNAVGPAYLAKVLQSKAYGLYDPEFDGGLWVGRPYAKAAAWRRDPLHNISHGATAMQVARFLYLMETGQLVSPELSLEMKKIMGDPAINHKFVKGLNESRPGSRIFRKSGSWRSYHSDCAVVERDGRKYIAVALADHPNGSEWLSRLIVKMDDIVFNRDVVPMQVAAVQQ